MFTACADWKLFMKKVLSIKTIISILCIFGIVSGFFLTADAKASVKMKKHLIMPVNSYRKLTLKGAKRKKVKWLSSDEKVASVSKHGKVRAESSGKAVITAQYGKKKYKCNVTVKTLLIAHRGYSGKYPENTVVSFEKAFEKGYDGIECDVWETKSGDLLISHDASVHRVTGKKKFIWNISKKSRKKYPIRYFEKGKKKKAYIPTFKETAENVFENNGSLFLHLKTSPKRGIDFSKKAVKKVMRILRYYNLTSKTLVFKSDTTVIGRFRKYGVKRGVFINPNTKKEYKKLIRWCNNNSIDTLILGTYKRAAKIAKPEFVFKYARKRKTEIGFYHVDSKNTYDLLSKNGAPFAFANHYVR